MSKRKHPMFLLLKRVLSPNSNLSKVERLCALAIGDRMDLEGECWPSIKDISERAGCNEKSGRRAVHVLLEGDPKRKILPYFNRRWIAGQRTPLYCLVKSPDLFLKAREKDRKKNPKTDWEKVVSLHRAYDRGDLKDRDYQTRLARARGFGIR